MTDELVREGSVRTSKPLPRAVLRDGRLSFGARALFAFIWDLPIGWSVSIEHLAKMGPEKRDAIRSRLRELEKVEALRIERLRGDGGRLEGCRWVLVAPERWARELPLSGLPRVPRIQRSVAPALVMPGLEKMPTKGLQEDGSPIKKAEHTQKNAVDNLRNLGLLLQNKEDYVNAERLFSELGGRLDLVRNAIALVRARKKKNRPYLSSVSVEALKLLAEERYKNQIADSLAATARKMSSL